MEHETVLKTPSPALPKFEVRIRQYDGLAAVWVPRLHRYDFMNEENYVVTWENTMVFDPLVHEMSTTGVLMEKLV